MIIGIGVDVLKIQRLNDLNESFLSAVYTEKERAEAGRRDSPRMFYATRFAGKEAVFKCFGGVPGEIRWNEIEILPGASGKPTVRLSGACLEHAVALGIKKILVSLSYDGDYAVAYAAAEG